MQEGNITKHQLERLITAVEHEMDIDPLVEPRVAVTDRDSDSNEAHVVDMDNLTCTCSDYEYNCKPEEDSPSDSKYCKHVFRAVFEKHRML